ncbi:aliphatic sulfonate ABC transporter substrate-binding protein [Phyllobacterium meliloti]|uniref:aliphatic sulfonate ABC transporter substrate-binding protein n=1 Tax=Phyllobacterium meliloti TaxID=555317 RepID=UPI001D13BAEF|nr:aliphatic sulfonate ABC transporter substrate-binding protein [Phyllobacterium sp. T1293]UGX84760.1 aliphatic sulfonate ABC transporter substrate-binding protein [Phyllobacterium sp. T1293]
MLTRRQTLALLGAGAVTVLIPLTSRANAEPLKTLRIGWQKGGVLALAKGTGALEKRLEARGIAVSWAEFSSGPPLLEALGAGAVDFGPTGDVPPLFAQAAGGNLVYAGTYKGSPDGSAILVQKDSPIQSLADLKGKRVAFKRGSSAHNFTVKALRTVGLSINDIKASDLSPSDAAAAFSSGQIDAWSIWDPYLAVAEKRPETRVLATGRGIVDTWSYFLSNGDFTTAHGDVLTEVLDELAKVGRAAQDNLDQTVAALSKITGVPEDIQRITLTREGLRLGDVTGVTPEAVAYQQALADEFYDLKIIPKKLDISSIVWKGQPS